MGEQVHHPDHYNSHPSGVECCQLTDAMSFNVGNALKYLFRASLKHECPLVDLKKALWYLDRERTCSHYQCGAKCETVKPGGILRKFLAVENNPIIRMVLNYAFNGQNREVLVEAIDALDDVIDRMEHADGR